ncbi:MAG: zinc ribbon domain-containing protein [Blastocatellia bacterium]
MPITCPRCETNVPDEALYCPYCNLQKPKNESATTAVATAEKGKPTLKSKAPMRSASSHKMSKRPHKRSRSSQPRRLRLPVLSVAALVALLGVGAYIFIIPLVHSEEAEPKQVLSALDKLRRMPSNEPDLTIDARLTRELEKSRRVKNLVGYQGWTAKPVKGSKSKVLLVFSYDEVGDVHQRAEWLADLSNNTFTPQTELASAVFAN